MRPVTSLTKRAIRASFLKLLNERPLNKITVKDIVEDCGINRNSFYYHYTDIPALAEEIVKDEAARIVQEYPTVDSLEQCLEIAVEFALQNRTAVLHLYNSASHEAYELLPTCCLPKCGRLCAQCSEREASEHCAFLFYSASTAEETIMSMTFWVLTISRK